MSKKKISRISINTLEKISKESQQIITEQWEGIDVTMRHSLPFIDMLNFSNEVVDSCFTPDGDFVPSVFDFAIKSGVLVYYANFTLPDNIENRYALIYSTNAFNFVMEYINTTQLNEIINASKKKISYLCNRDLLAVRSKLNELIAVFDGMQNQTTRMLENLSEEEMITLLNSISTSGSLSEEKIVDAYIDKARQSLEPQEGGIDGAQQESYTE